MAMTFSDTTNRTGIIQLIEDMTGTQSATTSSYTLATKTRDVNNTYANYFIITNSSDGTWQADDTNHTNSPVIDANLVANQQDYSFTVDGSATPNQILDIYRIEIKNSVGVASELIPIDQADITGQALTEYLSTAGTPKYYDKVGNDIILYPKPSYSYTSGLTIYYNRTPSYFLSTDTTKKPGIPDVFHEYLAIRPSYQYCLRKGLPQTLALKADLTMLEKAIKDYYANRPKDEKRRMVASSENNR